LEALKISFTANCCSLL